MNQDRVTYKGVTYDAVESLDACNGCAFLTRDSDCGNPNRSSLPCVIHKRFDRRSIIWIKSANQEQPMPTQNTAAMPMPTPTPTFKYMADKASHVSTVDSVVKPINPGDCQTLFGAPVYSLDNGTYIRMDVALDRAEEGWWHVAAYNGTGKFGSTIKIQFLTLTPVVL